MWTTAASVWVKILNCKLGKAEIIPTFIQTRLFEKPTGFERHRLRLWRDILGLSVRVLEDTQGLMGLTLLICAYINLPQAVQPKSVIDFQDTHFTLAVYLACLSSSSHLASLIVMRDFIDTHRIQTMIRVFMIMVLAILLTATVDLSALAFVPFFVVMERLLLWDWKMSPQVEFNLEYVVPPMVMVYIFWISISQLVASREAREQRLHKAWRAIRPYTIGLALDWPKHRDRLGPERYNRLTTPIKVFIKLCIFSNPLSMFLAQIASAILALVFVLMQKFTPAPIPTEAERASGIIAWCSLNNLSDNVWVYGQSYALFFLLVLLYSTTH